MAQALTIPDKQGKVRDANPLPIKIVEGDDILDLQNFGDISAAAVFDISNLDNYKITDKDNDASPNYYGFTDKDGKWYILKWTVSAGADTFRYAKGTADYTTNWTGRAGLSYDYFYNVF